MQKLLVKIFIKDYQNTKSHNVRAKYGTLAGIVGIVTNVLLAIMKIIVGIVTFSIGILADGINNMADALSSIITIIGFKMSARPPDLEHPFGHKRIEYITGMIISFIILIIGFSLAKESFLKILTPTNIKIDYVVILLMSLSILVKLWQAYFYRKMAKIIDSITLRASAVDSLNDSIITLTLVMGMVVFILTKHRVNIDGYLGIVVAVAILVAGFRLLKETINPLLGNLPSNAQINKITDKINSYEGVYGIHDLVCHNYGPNSCYATVHVEVSREVDVMVSHDLIDNIEMDFKKDFGIDLTIHMDPIEVNDELTNVIKKDIEAIINLYDQAITFHDFRVVNALSHTNIIFDVAIPPAYKDSPSVVRNKITKLISDYNPTWHAVIHVDQMYIRNIKFKN